MLRDAALQPSLRPAPAQDADGAVVPVATQRLLTGWLGLAVASLVVAGFFAALAAFTRTPAVQLLPSARLFHHALVSHVTFAFTVWFVTFAGALWVYVAWRAGYPLPAAPSWAGLALATGGSAAMAVPAFRAAGTPYLNDYVPVIDHPLFWLGLGLVAAGVTLQATAYLVARWRARRSRAFADPPEARAMGLAAVALVLAVGTLLVALARLDPVVPFGYRLRALVWGPGHLLQFLHVAGMAAVWFVAAAVAIGAVPPAPRALRLLLGTLGLAAAATAATYLAWRPETLLANHVVTILTFGGLGAGSVPIALMAVAGWAGRPRRWSSPLVSGTALSVGLFAVGGLLGVVGFNQDTRVPAHYHGMVGAVTLAYMGFAPLLLEICGRRPWSARLTRWQPYLYGLGLLGLMAGLHWAGGHGAPRKTFGFNWADAQALLALNLMGLGSLLAILGGLAFVVNMGLPLLFPPDRGVPAPLPRGRSSVGPGERAASPRITATISAYVESLKLRIGTFIGMAAVLGYLATAPGPPAPRALLLLFAVTVLAASGAGALNHFFDRDLDARMPRTSRRPLPSGRIRHGWSVVGLGLGLIALAVGVALWRLHPLVALHVFLGAFTYVVVYTIWLKRRSWLNVVIGGLAGSFAVMAGGSLARPELCLPPVLFAAVLFFWSPSHFWSLALAYKQDYAAAGIPMLPVVKGEAGTVRAILLNTAGLLLTSLAPFVLGSLGLVYLTFGVAAGGGVLVVRNVQLAVQPADRRRALRSFHASNLFLLLLFLGVALDVAVRRW